MGAQQSTSLLETQLISVKSEITPAKLRKLHKQVLFEYPFLANVFESVLICDNRLPDCPIVFCNDLFEQMTLYPKEEIIGKNCRFLQGKGTDLQLVKQIRKAVDEGLELDVEILNYRKDGVPFFNNFLMLPIHSTNKTTGKVCYFIAIQKDITVLRQPTSKPTEWNPAEVGVWLFYIGFHKFTNQFIEAGIDGEKLAKLTAEDLEQDFKMTVSEKRVLLTRILELSVQGPAAAFQTDKSKEIQYQAPGENVDKSGVRKWWRNINMGSSEDGNDNGEGNGGDGDDEAENKNNTVKISNDGIARDSIMTIKIFYRKTIKLLHVPKTISYDQLCHRIRTLLKVDVKIKYKDFDGEWLSLEDDDSVEAAVLCMNGGNLQLKVQKRYAQLHDDQKLYLDVLPIGIAVLDGEKDIIYINNHGQALLNLEPHEYVRKSFKKLVAPIKLKTRQTQIAKINENLTISLTVSQDTVDTNFVVTMAVKNE